MIAATGALAFICTSLYYAFPHILAFGVRSQIQLQEGNEIYEKWIRVPIPIDFKFYFFEVRNPREATSTGAKVKLKQRGPYWFK